jgi:hypothetical protein
MADDFRKRMGITAATQEEAKTKFLNRIRVGIFHWLQDNDRAKFFDEHFIWWISEQMGESWGNEVHRRDYGEGYYSYLTLDKMAGQDFYKTLEIVEKCYQYIAEGRARNIEGYGSYYIDTSKLVNTEKFEERMTNIMLLSETDIGVFWKDRKFYLSGAKELDEALIADPLDWLAQWPRAREQFTIALDHYKKSLTNTAAGKDAITNCYTSMEMLSQEFLQNDRSFDKNSDALVNKLTLPKEYRNVVHYYKQVANEYGSRHAGSDPAHREVEAFVYLTGLLMRLMAHS